MQHLTLCRCELKIPFVQQNIKHMKTRTRHLTVRNLQVHIAFMIFLLIMLLLSIFTKVNAQSETPNLNDPHLSAKGKFMAGVITTWAGTIPPPVLIADVTYGISNRVSLGIVAGTTGELALYGLKFNASVYQKNNFSCLVPNNAGAPVYLPGMRSRSAVGREKWFEANHNL